MHLASLASCSCRNASFLSFSRRRQDEEEPKDFEWLGLDMAISPHKWGQMMLIYVNFNSEHGSLLAQKNKGELDTAEEK